MVAGDSTSGHIGWKGLYWCYEQLVLLCIDRPNGTLALRQGPTRSPGQTSSCTVITYGMATLMAASLHSNNHFSVLITRQCALSALVEDGMSTFKALSSLGKYCVRFWKLTAACSGATACEGI